ncbi:MAG: CPBP family intramembrane glutamic endopeptidase [Methanobacterium sp.]
MKNVEGVQDQQFERRVSWEYKVTLVLYLLGLIVAELLTTYVNKMWGLSLHTTILFILLVNAAMVESADFSNLLRSLMPIPIIRIVGLSIPMMQIKPLYWFPIVAIPLFAASIVIMRRQKLTLKDVGVFMGDYRDNYRVQFFIALTGFFTGIIEFFILRPDPLIPQFTPVLLIGGFIVLLLSTGLAEELLFRGILQNNTMKFIGTGWGLLYTSLVFCTMHIGWIYFADLVFVFGVALFYGFCLIKTKSIVGVTMAHGISNSMLFLVMPFVNLAYFGLH